MRQTIHQPLHLTLMMLFGVVATSLLLQPISSASAQQLTSPASQETSRTGIQSRRLDNVTSVPPSPMKLLEKKDAQSAVRKPHRLIRKPDSSPLATVELSPSASLPAISSAPQSDNPTSQPKEPSSLSRSVGSTLPLAAMSTAPSPTTGSLAASTAAAGSVPLAAASTANSGNSGPGGSGGRTMRRLAAEMPRLAQLIAPPSAPAVSVVPAIGTSPASLSFAAQQGGSNPAAQTLTISNIGGGTLSWTASDSAVWMSLSSSAGTGAGSVSVSVATGALTSGSYSGTVMLSATGASPVIVPVSFTVTTAPVAPAIGASPTSFSFTAQAGSNPATQTLTISNTGGGALNWTASDNAAWLTLSTASGTGNGSTTLTVNTATLTTGSHNALVTVSAPGATSVSIPVALTVTAAPVAPAIGASPTSLSFTAQQGGANPATQALAISNTGGGTLTWTASDDAAWLSVAPASGTGNGSATVTALLGTLTTGTHTGTITLSATGTSPVSVPVSLTVTAAPVPPAIGASPTSLTFAATQGGSNPANQTLTISNTGGGTLTWSVSDSAAWLTASPSSGSGNGAVTMTVATGTLTAGSYSGTITIAATGATSVTIPVTFAVVAPPAIGMSPSSLSFTAQQGAGNPVAQTLNISNTGGGTLSWSATPDTTWLAASPSSATGNGTVSVCVTTGILTAGSYTGNITLSATGASSRTVPVTFTITAAPSISLSPTSLTYTATQGGSNPANQTVTLTNTGGVANWAVSDNASWLSVSPTSGNNSSTLTATVNTTGLTAGAYTGTITVSATGATSRTVAVTLTVSAPITSSATLTWSPSIDSDLAGYKIYQRTASSTYGAAIATVPAGTVSYLVTGLSAHTTYFFAVTAYDIAGNESGQSNEARQDVP
jgi:hypothetical protein